MDLFTGLGNWFLADVWSNTLMQVFVIAVLGYMIDRIGSIHLQEMDNTWLQLTHFCIQCGNVCSLHLHTTRTVFHVFDVEKA